MLSSGLGLPWAAAASLAEDFWALRPLSGHAFSLGDALDPFGSSAAYPSDVIRVPAPQCFCTDLEVKSDCGVFGINSTLTDKQVRKLGTFTEQDVSSR